MKMLGRMVLVAFFLSVVSNPAAQEITSNERNSFSRSHKTGRLDKTWTESNTGVEFVWVPGGCYQMGCGSDYNKSTRCSGDEQPVHEVCVDGFYMGKYEVTVGQWQRFIRASNYKTDAEKDTGGVKGCYSVYDGKWGWREGRNWADPGFLQSIVHPVVCVSHNDVTVFLGWLNRQRNKAFRLPTEAEWEYAARSGGKRKRYAGSDSIDSIAWYLENSGKTTHSVGSKSPNGLGLYDMSGNVWEWCSDFYGANYYQSSPRDNPHGPSSGSVRVLRGGSWCNGPAYVRAACRDGGGVATRNDYLGFRLVFSGQ